jgi:hypothetical protein
MKRQTSTHSLPHAPNPPSRQRLQPGTLCLLALVSCALVLAGCATGPELTGYPVNTPQFYTENKVFFVKPLGDAQYTASELEFQHLYQVSPADRTNDAIKHNDPLSVVLQGVRLPEDLPGGNRDIAVVLDIHTSGEKGVVTLVAFYQRDVPPGQMLNFNNLLVYSDPMWDSANPPYFRIRVLDVKAERNRSTGAILSKLSNLSSQISGVVPHPVIPLVTSAIDAANLLLSNQKNVMLLDFQVQFYGLQQVSAAGGATLGPLLAGQWLVVGRAQGADSGFWNSQFYLERKTDRILEKHTSGTAEGTNRQDQFTPRPVPYVSVALLRADAQVPKLVLDRSESLISLLSSASGKSDVDSLDAVASSLTSAIDAFTIERRLRKYRSALDLKALINKLEAQDGDNANKLNGNELRRILYILDRVAEPSPHHPTAAGWIKWWNVDGGNNGQFEDKNGSPLGVVWKWNKPS